MTAPVLPPKLSSVSARPRSTLAHARLAVPDEPTEPAEQAEPARDGGAPVA